MLCAAACLARPISQNPVLLKSGMACDKEDSKAHIHTRHRPICGAYTPVPTMIAFAEPAIEWIDPSRPATMRRERHCDRIADTLPGRCCTCYLVW